MWWRRSAGARRSPPYGCSIDRCCAARAPPTYFISISSQEAGNNLQINCHFYGGGAAGCTRSAVRDDVVQERVKARLTSSWTLTLSPLVCFIWFIWVGMVLFIYLCISIVFVLTIYAPFCLLNVELLGSFTSNLQHFETFLVRKPLWFGLRNDVTSHQSREQMQPPQFNGPVAPAQEK